MLPVLGFSPDQTTAVHVVLAKADLALRQCNESCKAKDDRFKRQFERWFYEPVEGNGPSVDLLVWTVKQMVDRFSDPGGNLAVVSCNKPRMGKDYGQTTSLTNRIGARAGNVRDDIDSIYSYRKEQNKGAVKLRLADSFFTLPVASGENETQVMVFLHELSHWAAGTRDLHVYTKSERQADPSKEELRCHGTSAGIELAVARGKYQNGVMRAVLNADSIAFFISSFGN